MTVEEHYKTLAPKLTNWLVATGSSYSDACDLVQQTFLKLWSMRDDLRDSNSDVSGLVFTIARNLRKNQWRDNSRLEFTDEIKEDARGTTPETIAESDAEYLRAKIQEAFDKLPPVLREAYTLFQIAELSIHEIALQTGVSEALVKVRIFRAKEKLREYLTQIHVTF